VCVKRLLPTLIVLGLSTGCVPNLVTPDTYDEGGDTEDSWTWEAPTNDWCVGEPEQGLVAEGFEVGQVPPDFRMADQKGQTLSLWQFYGKVVVLDISAIWCAPCQDLAQGTQETVEHFADDEFMYVTLLSQDLENNAPDHEDLNLWGDTFAISGAPIIGDDSDMTYTGPPIDQNAGQLPILLVIDPTMRVAQQVTPPSDENLRIAVENVLAR